MSAEIEKLVPLRIPAGWCVDWNQLRVIAPTPENAAHFGGSSLFTARHEARRFVVDVEWRPEFDVSGEYCLRIHYQPWPRTPTGKRRQDGSWHLDGEAKVMHAFCTRELEALAAELERWLEKCAGWSVEAN